jgi:hypothetical protein
VKVTLLICVAMWVACFLFIWLYDAPKETEKPTYDYERMAFCIIDRGDGLTIAEQMRVLRFCVELDQ